MARTRFDHVCLLVRDLEAAVNDYREILKVLAPEDAVEIVFEQASEGGFPYRAATFVSRSGQTVLQFLESRHPKDEKRLRERGECVHHLEFCSSDIDATFQELKTAGVPLASDHLVAPADKPWHKSVLVAPGATHGVLVKVAAEYRVRDGAWVPGEPPAERGS